MRTTSSVPGAGGVVGRSIDLGHPVSPGHPLRILLVGDSVMLSEAPAVEALFDSTREAAVFNESQWGYGLTNLHDWASKLTQWLAQDRPDIVVAMWSWDNTAARGRPGRLPSGARAVCADRAQPD